MSPHRPEGPGLPFERTVKGWGVSARFNVSSTALLKSALLGLPAGFRPSRTPAPDTSFEIRTTSGHVEVREESPVNLGRSRRAVTRYVESRMEALASTRSPEFAFLHAGCIEIGGKAVLFPGRSGAGKSTLVTEFLKRGCRYLSDDLAPIDSRCRVHPFPRGIGLRRGGVSRRVSALSLGVATATKALPIAMIWCGRYDPLAGQATFERLAGGAAFLELLAHAPGARVTPEVVVPTLSQMARTIPIYCGTRGSSESMVDAVTSRLAL